MWHKCSIQNYDMPDKELIKSGTGKHQADKINEMKRFRKWQQKRRSKNMEVLSGTKT